jgi:hypothetical protein
LEERIVRNYSLIFSLLCGLTMLPAAALAQTVPLTQDTYFVPLNHANYGISPTLQVGGLDGADTLVQFDLTALPTGITGSNIAKATLTLFVNRVDLAGMVDISVADGPWFELTVNGRNTPPVAGAAVSEVPVSAAGDYITVDATQAVQGWVNGTFNNDGFIITPAGSVKVEFDSKENRGTSHPATLAITLVNSGPTGATGAQGSAGATGTQGPAGPAGATGAQGPAGATGAQGTAGATGGQGSVGASGAQGPVGPAGTVGPVGPAGATGLEGPAGPTGATGVQGPAGATGARGPSGPSGPAGTAGIFGTNNIPFSQGTSAGATCTLGSLLLNASAVYPKNYLPADGRLLPIAANTALFALIGISYGGNGFTTFALPNLQAAAPNNTQYLICVVGLLP